MGLIVVWPQSWRRSFVECKLWWHANPWCWWTIVDTVDHIITDRIRNTRCERLKKCCLPGQMEVAQARYCTSEYEGWQGSYGATPTSAKNGLGGPCSQFVLGERDEADFASDYTVSFSKVRIFGLRTGFRCWLQYSLWVWLKLATNHHSNH